MPPSKRRVQRHHIQYAVPEHKIRDIIVPLYQGEHYIVSQIQRLKPENTSRQFLAAVRVLLDQFEPFAHSIEE